MTGKAPAPRPVRGRSANASAASRHHSVRFEELAETSRPGVFPAPVAGSALWVTSPSSPPSAPTAMTTSASDSDRRGGSQRTPGVAPLARGDLDPFLGADQLAHPERKGDEADDRDDAEQDPAGDCGRRAGRPIPRGRRA